MTRFGAGADAGAVAASLDRFGYAIVEGVLDAAAVASAHAELSAMLAGEPLGAHEYVGLRTRRAGRLFARTRSMDAAAVWPLLHAVLDIVIGDHQLTAPTVIELLPGEEAGAWHHDDYFYPLRRPHVPLVVNTLWAIDDFTAANGATQLLARSHLWGEGRLPLHERPVIAEMPAGSVVLFQGTLWHRNGDNLTDASRIAVSLEFAASWLRPQETLTLSVPPRVVAGLDPALRELLGYGMSPRGLGHVGGRHPLEALPDLAREPWGD